ELMRVGRIAGYPLRPLPRRRLDPHPVVELRQDGVEDAERAALALYTCVDLDQRGGEQRAGDPPGRAVGKAELGTQPAIDLGTEALRLPGHDRRLGAGEKAQDADRVAAGVHGGTAGKIEPVADVARQRQWDAHGGLHVADLAQLAAGEDRTEPLRQRMVAPV